MSTVSKRSFLVRDDGTGRAGNEEVGISEFADAEAVVILGDPGIGKTTLLKELGGDNYSKVRRFLAAPFLPVAGFVFLDALDEYRNVATSQDAILEVARTLAALGKPNFRLSCRAADWFGSVDQHVLGAASPSGRIVVLELLPLNAEEIRHVIDGLVTSPESFLVEARSLGLSPLLGNPQTLELIARAWRGGRRPINKFEAYKFGTEELLKEINSAHVVRSGQSTLESLRGAAGSIASSLMLSNTDGIWRIETSDSDDAVLADIPHASTVELESVLKRRVFTSTRADRFEFIHRTVQEFLAAEDLSKRISNGLPIDRALALICGIDGVPVSSLRGLYGWLMCELGTSALPYVSRDPYAVVTYGDAGVLSPEVQRALWESLRSQRDPWFLSSDDRGGSFCKLANRNTAELLVEILDDRSASSHLRIAVLESIAAAEEDLGVTSVVRQIVLSRTQDLWLRSTALKAFVRLTSADPKALEKIDRELAQEPADGTAPEVRLELLRLTLNDPRVAERTLSVLEQYGSSDRSRRTIGGVYRLSKEFPSDQIDAALGGIGRVRRGAGRHNYEVEAFFRSLLTKRLRSHDPLDVPAVAKVLLSLRDVGHHEKDLPEALRLRLQKEPNLLSVLFDELLLHENTGSTFWGFVAHHLWRAIPPAVWPLEPSLFLLERAKAETVGDRAADMFRMYVAWFPRTNATVALAEAGFEFVEGRTDVKRELGKWNVCTIENWRLDDHQRRDKEHQKRDSSRKATISALMPRLAQISSGSDTRALEWGVAVYLGFYNDVDGDTPRARFENAANSDIEDAFIQGAIQFLRRQDIPTAQAVISSWNSNRIPYVHTLLAASVYLSETKGLPVPTASIPSCVAAVVTSYADDKVPDFKKTVEGWFVQQATSSWPLVKPVLRELWLANQASLPGLHLLSAERALDFCVADLSTDVLRSSFGGDELARNLVAVLLDRDKEATWAISQDKLGDPSLTRIQRAIWLTAAYLIRPFEGESAWKTLETEPEDALWEAVELAQSRTERLGPSALLPKQRAALIMMIGKRFPAVGYPTEGWSGSRNPWDATSFIGKQIEAIAADSSDEASACMDAIERDPNLRTYRDLISHRRAEQDRARRDSKFTVPTPQQVRQALMNLAPATAIDLLAYVMDHMHALSRELAHTQRERYRAYWNERGRKLISPKREEVCSGLFAEDLQNRVRAQVLTVTVEHHMVDDKECDVVVLQGPDRLLPIEVKHHFHSELWTAWQTQLQRLYAREAAADGVGVYLILWSGVGPGRKIPKAPTGIARPSSPDELKVALESQIPLVDRQRLRIFVLDISGPVERPNQKARDKKRPRRKRSESRRAPRTRSPTRQGTRREVALSRAKKKSPNRRSTKQARIKKKMNKPRTR